MKKLILLILTTCQIAVPSVLIQRFSTVGKSWRSVVNTLRHYPYMISQQQRRTLTERDAHLLKGCDQLGLQSPALGAFAWADFSYIGKSIVVRDWYTEEGNPLGVAAKLFFYQNPEDGQMSITQYNKEIVTVFPPALVADLLKASKDNSTLSDEQKEKHIRDWFKRYQEMPVGIERYSEKSFKKKAKQLLTAYEKATEKLKENQRSFFLLAVLFRAAQSRVDLVEFAKQYGITLDPSEEYTQADRETAEDCFKRQNYCVAVGGVRNKDTRLGIGDFLVWKNSVASASEIVDSNVYKKLLAVPQIRLSYKGSALTALCVEETVRTFVQCLLLDRTKRLSFSMLPKKVEESCKKNSPAFYAFIQKYGDPSVKGYYQKSAQEWLALLSELPGFEYVQQRFELYGGPQILNLICHLFGIDPVKTYEELAAALSTAERTVVLDHKDDLVKILFKNGDDVQEIGTAVFSIGHGYFIFEKDENNTNATRVLEANYNQLISNDGTQYNILACQPFKDLTQDELKRGIDQLTVEQLPNALNEISKYELNKNAISSIYYFLLKIKAAFPIFNYSKFIFEVLKKSDEAVAEFLLFSQKIVRVNINYIDGRGKNFIEIASRNKKFSKAFNEKIIAAYSAGRSASAKLISCRYNATPLTSDEIKRGLDGFNDMQLDMFLESVWTEAIKAFFNTVELMEYLLITIGSHMPLNSNYHEFMVNALGVVDEPVADFLIFSQKILPIDSGYIRRFINVSFLKAAYSNTNLSNEFIKKMILDFSDTTFEADILFSHITKDRLEVISFLLEAGRFNFYFTSNKKTVFEFLLTSDLLTQDLVDQFLNNPQFDVLYKSIESGKTMKQLLKEKGFLN